MEARFRECLDQEDRAREALERAFRANPRQDWLAVRLARKYRDGGETTRSEGILKACLGENPNSKLANLELGRLLSTDGRGDAAMAYLRRGFTRGDGNYEAQFWYARELYLRGQFEEAANGFGELHDRAPGRYRPRAGAFVEENGRAKV